MDNSTEQLLARFDAQADVLDQPRAVKGRPRKYTDASLREVAAVYLKALEGGSHTPTKDVAAILDIPYSSAAKLVGRCRPPHGDLLPPATQPLAGDLRPPEPDPGPSRESGQIAANDGEE
jgi:hypothetical protein